MLDQHADLSAFQIEVQDSENRFAADPEKTMQWNIGV